MKQNTSLQIIGTYLNDLVDALSQMGIKVENVIEKVNPITLMFEPDVEKQHYGNKITDECACLDIKKNLKQVLSHDPNHFDDNVVKNKLGAEVRYANTSEYILIYNSYMNCRLLTENDVLYTYKTPINDFEKEIVQNKEAILDYTYLKSIDWKAYYDKFIQVILSEYTPEHIILLRNGICPYYVSDEGIKRFDKDFSEYKAFIEEVDDYFFEQTKCFCINDLYYSVSDRNPGCIAPAELRSKEVLKNVAEKIGSIINGTEAYETYRQKAPNRIKKDEIRTTGDIITLYHFYNLYHDKVEFKKLLESVVVNKDIFIKNREYLKKYPYVSKEMDFSEQEKETECYWKLEHGYYIRIQSQDNCQMKLENYLEEKVYSFEDIRENDFYIPWGYAEKLCGDLRFYVERAKNGCGNTPIKICFSDRQELIKSMFLVDWSHILENERYILEVGKSWVDIQENYVTRTNLEFLFQSNVKIVVMQSGLCDQIFRYLLAQYLYDGTEYDIYYDDTYFVRKIVFNGFEIDKVLKTPLRRDRLLSYVFSPMLLEQNFINGVGLQIADVLYEAGLENISVLCNDEVRNKEVKKAKSILLQGYACYDAARLATNSLQYVNLCPAAVPAPDLLKKHIKFPEFEEQRNIQIASKMQVSEAVVLHVRRGDFAAFNRVVSSEFYFESLKKINNISKYKNKKIYVFSDDILWCKEHKEELGLCLNPNTEVCFVDHNKGENSYRDVQLMSYGKVIIGSDCGFVRLAILMAKNLEVFMCSDSALMYGVERVGVKNKYSVGAYTKDYSAHQWENDLWSAEAVYIS